MTVEANKSVIRTYLELVNARDTGGIAAHFADTVLANGQEFSLAAYIHASDALLDAFPDLQISVDELLAEGDAVAARATWSGTHRGAFLGIAPTGKHVSFAACGMWHLRDGRITAVWFQRDLPGLLGQLGATIAPPAPPSG